jgi:aldose 1-epimerase
LTKNSSPFSLKKSPSPCDFWLRQQKKNMPFETMSFNTLKANTAAAGANAISVEKWGTLPDGREASLFTLDNRRGLRMRISNYGATIVSVETPDNKGVVADVALGYDTLEGYLRDSGTYFGAVVGRVANRIAGGKFSLDGKTYELAKNNTPGGIPCSLHGGITGFDKVLWDATPLVDRTGAQQLRLRYRSVNGEEGYPGNLDVIVTYTLLADAKTFRVDYEAVTDAPTPVNLSQHSYFNLAGAGVGDILKHQLLLAAFQFTPVNAGLIPDGRLLSVKGTPFDFLEPRAIGSRINADHEQLAFGGGYDHNWVLGGDGSLHLAASVFDQVSGRGMEIFTTEPGVQFYSGNFLDGVKGKGGKTYAYRSAFALETQRYPDSPNQPAFPSVILRPGETYRSRTEYRFWTR